MSFLCLIPICFMPLELDSMNANDVPDITNEPAKISVSLHSVTNSCDTLEAALNKALNQDPRIDEARSIVEQNKSERGIAKAARYPQLSGFGRAGVGDGLQADNQIDNRVGVRLSQQLFDFGVTRYAAEAAQARVQSAEHEVQAQRSSVALEVVEAYLAFLSAQERLNAIKKIEEFYAQDAALVDKQLEHNLLKASEGSSIKAEYSLALSRRAREELEVVRRQTQLNILTGTDFRCGNEASVSSFLAVRSPHNIETALNEAMRKSARLNSAKADIKATEADVKRGRSERLPSVSLAGTITYDYDDFTDSFEQRDRIGIDINVPIFEGGRKFYATKGAKARAQGAKARLAREEQSLREHVIRSWAEVTYLKNASEMQLKARESFSALSSAVDKEYEVGVLTVSELIRAKRDYYDAILTEINTRYELYSQQLVLIADSGRLLKNVTIGDK